MEDLTPAERRLRALMGVYFLLFAPSGLVFALAPNSVAEWVNWVSAGIWPSLPPAPAEETRIWVSLSVAMMAMIAVIAAMVWRDVRRNARLVPLILLSKLTSSVMGAGTFILAEKRYLVDLTVFTTDFPLFVLAAWLYRRAVSSRDSRASAPGS